MAFTWTRILVVAALLCAAALAAQPAAAQGCGALPAGKTGQCNELGSIVADEQRQVDGQPIEIAVQITVEQLFREQDARSFMFSVRNSSVGDTESPVTLQVLRFATASGNVAVTRTEVSGDHEVNLWVDYVDLPIGEPIELVVQVGSKEPGGFRLEALVIAFDRGYDPVRTPSGADATLYASTFLSVSKATGGGGGGPFPAKSLAKSLPGPEPLAVSLAVAGLALVAARRRPPGEGRREAAGKAPRPAFRSR